MSEFIDVVSGEATYRGLRTQTGDRFLGIRYAEPPVGSLRFKPPVPHTNVGLIDATHYGKASAQTVRRLPDWAPKGEGFETGEDCLNLNIFTPAADGKRRPVIVHSFGGGFQTGSANGTFHDEPGFTQAGDVVLVRPNMRVGALGFLHLGDHFGQEYAATNRGMLDFIAALRWVRDNIEAFGGDPNNVTLAGMSSGSFTIAALFGVDDVSHLYRRVWLMSGPASRIIARDTAARVAEDFLTRAGIAPGDSAALETLPVETILATQDQVLSTHLGERNAPGGRSFGIVFDGTSLVRHPLDGLASGRYAGHQLVTGWTRHEARMWYAFGTMPEVPTREQLLLSIGRFRPDDAEEVLTALEAEQPGRSFTQYEETFLSRAIYRDPALRTVEAQRAAGGIAHAYEFAWVPAFEGGRLGSAHGFDEPFVFNSLGKVPLAADDPGASVLAETMSAALIQYARTGTVSDWPQPWRVFQ